MAKETEMTSEPGNTHKEWHEERMTIKLEDFLSIQQVLEKLRMKTSANSILLIDRKGQLITGVGMTEYLDINSFASLSSAEVAASMRMASLIAEREYSFFFQNEKQENIYVSLVDSKVILVVLFDKKSKWIMLGY